MVKLLFVLFSFAAGSAHANSFPLAGEPADRLVNALVKLGSDPVGTHEYFQAGVTACTKRIDGQGTYFPGGAIGDYTGESCLLYGSDADDSDEDGTLRVDLAIPADDRGLLRHPDLAAKLADLRNLREQLEALVVPLVDTTPVNGQSVVISEVVGIGGIACDGRTGNGARVCYVKPSSQCPPRGSR